VTDLLPSWRTGAARDALLTFLEAASDLPVADRVAYFDNDGTLWCEKPQYVQLDFYLDALGRRVAADPTTAEREEFAALLGGDSAAIHELGLARIALALASLFEGQTPEEFQAEARDFVARHPGRVYRPMLELIAELRRRDFTVGIITGGGTEFVRAVSEQLYGVPPHLVVGTLIDYRFDRNEAGSPVLRRTASVLGSANEGEPKVLNIQTQLGRRPILAVGNSSGDREMLEWAAAGPGPTMALLVDHDDADREYSYVSKGATTADDEAITDVAARLGWVVASIAHDWEAVF
jgi:phosphoglycolate phosphatase-like HAD superfamily hydrolase